jgi:large repetitive protein
MVRIRALRKAPPLALAILALAFFFVTPALAVTYTITVQTDAPSYSGIQPITITGVVSPAPGPSTAVFVVIKGPSGAVVDLGSEAADAVTGAWRHVTVPGGTGNWTAGTYRINATWGGPGGSASQIATFSYVVPLATTTTAVACASPIAIAAASTCAATVTGTSGAVTGETVTFSVQSGGSGSVTLPSTPTCSLSSGTCFLTVTGATAGSVTIKASYPGDSNNAASSGTASMTVTQATTTTSVSCTYPGANVYSCTASVSGAAGTISGETVIFSQTAGSGSATFPSPATCTLSGTSCQIAVTGSSSGPVTIQASYRGDTNNAGSSGTASITVNVTTTVPVTTTTTVTSSSSSTTSTQTSTVSSTRTTTTSTSQSSAPSSSGGLGSLTYVIIAILVIIVIAVGVVMWRRSVASKYGRPST